jgi:RHS repeat-associated protein
VSYDGTSWSAPLTEAIVPDAAGDWATEAITDAATPLTSTKTYSYDNDDRLTGVQDTLDGQCTTRAYDYDADSDRTSLTSYAPGIVGACQDSTGTTTTETYDSADRATNAGYAYDTQGDITTTPSADAGGSGNLTATYYADDMLDSQAQNGATETWTLDPTLGRYATYTQDGVTYTDHYSDTSNNPTWTSGSDGSWTRNVTDFNGNLAAEVTASGVTLELPDLHGDVMATASTSATATGPASIYVYTEFGTPETGDPATYGWLGGDQISSNALGGQLLMGARAYNTNSGRFSQADPVPGGSANAYDYAFQNPLSNYDLSGKCGWSWACVWYWTKYSAIWAASVFVGGILASACTGMFPWCAGLWGLIIGSAIAGGMAALACMADHQCSGWGILGVFIWTFATAMFTSWLGNTGAGLSKFDKIFYGLYGKIVDAGSYIMRRL